MDVNIINSYFKKYRIIVDSISEKFEYDDNLKHLLYVVITAFIVKYGLKNESLILNCFSNTKIYFGNCSDGILAFFDRKLLFDEKYFTQKYIVINSSISDNYVQYLDTIIHEFNHAINSMKNEIKEHNNKIYLRTGLSYVSYNKNNLGSGESKSKDFVLEEIINTKQTEEIIELILMFANYEIDDDEISNFLKSISSEISNSKYKSKAYYFQAYICRDLISNKTFISTLETLRFNGDIDVVEDWFDNIVGKKGRYTYLNDLLYNIFELEVKLESTKFLKSRILNKIANYNNIISRIINTFDNNCLYK